MSYSCKTQHQKPVIIRNPKSGFVLDACEYHVKIQHYSGSPSQKWTLQCLNQGKFMIINVGNGKALDIDNGAKICAKLITFHKHGKTNQQWYVNADGTLQCPVDNLVLDIVNGKYYPGNNIIAFPKHGRENQKFQLQPEYTNMVIPFFPTTNIKTLLICNKGYLLEFLESLEIIKSTHNPFEQVLNNRISFECPILSSLV